MNTPYVPGDVILVRQREDGSTFPALIDHISKGGRIYCRWENRTRTARGRLTRVVCLDPDKYETVTFAPDEDADFLHGLAARSPR